MQRITLASEDIKYLPDIKPGAYIKLMFNENGTPVTEKQVLEKAALLRTYTIRSLNKSFGKLIIDVALHSGDSANGPASDWAKYVTLGEQICFTSPGSLKAFPERYDWVLFAGDMTSMPAIETYLEQLPKETTGFVFLHVESTEDIREISKPEKVQISWLTKSNQRLADAIAQLKPLSGIPAIWAASEFSQMREMRKIFSEHLDVDRKQIYISSYWKKGRSEDQHKIDKRRDIEAVGK